MPAESGSRGIDGGASDAPVTAASQQGSSPGRAPKIAATDTKNIGAAVSKLISATIGDICLVMSRSPAHKHYALADIEWMILPPVLAGQCYVAEAAIAETGLRAPLAAVTWARVSAEVDARLREHAGSLVRLRPNEWTSGEHTWLIDTVGDPRGLNHAPRWLLDGPFKDRTAHVYVRDATGAPKVETLQTLAHAALSARSG